MGIGSDRMTTSKWDNNDYGGGNGGGGYDDDFGWVFVKYWIEIIK